MCSRITFTYKLCCEFARFEANLPAQFIFEGNLLAIRLKDQKNAKPTESKSLKAPIGELKHAIHKILSDSI